MICFKPVAVSKAWRVGQCRVWVMNVVSSASRSLPLLPQFRTYCCVAPLGDQPVDARRARRMAVIFAKLPNLPLRKE